MGIWCFIILSVLIGAVANEGTHPNNQTVALEEDMTKSQILERVDSLSNALSDKIKVFNDRVNKLLEKFEDKLQRFSTSAVQRMINLEQKLERLSEDTALYFMQPDPSKNVSFEVARDFTNNHGFGDNWIIFQRRFNGSVDFYRNWTEYKQGFGDLRGEHWLGLEKLHMIVKTQRHELLIVLEDYEGVIAYAHYDDFQIGNETEKYIIKSVGKYTGTAGDSFTHHKDELFTTYDQDNDKVDYNCAQSFVGGWWFYRCYHSHLNGEYLDGNNIRVAGINWNSFRGRKNSLKSTKMMVRPVAL
ncbi:microfibril-associated glycoprotein 4-like [Anopheles marshallii]|uniref:microfibril-associated glycoprotein 4-like n=1 Tax=Anopheles marshallii TaxID=1521116 RepID=UPI00237A2998|nr:microfibril-associated glycoprotein 4-like [Anopheles marshallii]